MRGSGGPVCYIHVGPPKTGTSSIQRCVRTNHKVLERRSLSRLRLVTPDGEKVRDVAGLVRAIELTPSGEPPAVSPLWDAAERAIERGQNMLISEERLCGVLQSPQRLQPLLSFFETRGCRVVVIAYVRDQPGWLNSWYVQTQKRLSGLESFDGFVAKAIETGKVDPNRYLAAFMLDRRVDLAVGMFEDAVRKGLERDFLARCDVAPVDDLDLSGSVNANFGAKSVFVAQELMRRAGPGLKALPGYAQTYNRFKRRCHSLGWDAAPYVALDPARYDAIRARFADGNDRFAHAFFGSSWRELSPARAVATHVFDPQAATAEELAEVTEVVETFADAFRRLRDGANGTERARTTEDATA